MAFIILTYNLKPEPLQGKNRNKKKKAGNKPRGVEHRDALSRFQLLADYLNSMRFYFSKEKWKVVWEINFYLGLTKRSDTF